MPEVAQAGYSGTPLVKKLGIKEGMAIWAKTAPPHYSSLLVGIPDGVHLHLDPQDKTYRLIHWFVQEKATLESEWLFVKSKLAKAGSLWISWPKGSSKLPKDLNETEIREIGLAGGLVDVKVCAVDFDWSGLKFMFRKEDR